MELELSNNDSALSMMQAGMNRVPPARNRESFLQYCVRMLTDVVDPKIRVILMAFLAKIISDQVKKLGTYPFEDVCGPSNNMSKVSLRFNEAFGKSLVDIVQMTMFIMVWAATYTMILTMSLRSKVLAATLVSLVPFYYFPPLLAKAPNFSVICGTFEVPIFWFVFLWALALSLLQGFVISVVLLISWKRMY